MSECFFEKYISKKGVEIDWHYLCQNTNISKEFFEKYIDKVDWGSLCVNTNLPEEFFEKYEPLNVLKWYCLCQNTNLSESFFEKYISHHEKKLIDWNYLCENSNMSESFFEKHILNGCKINWNSLTDNTFRVNHPKEKIIFYLKNNPQYSFDNLICKYI